MNGSDGTAPPDGSTTPSEGTAGSEDVEALVAQFLASPTSDLGTVVAGAMRRDGDPRWAWWLLDLLRLGPSTGTDESAALALAELSGIPRPDDASPVLDYRSYGQWAVGSAAPPGPGYRAWKVALYAPLDDAYRGLLSSVDDEQLLGRLQWGGVPRGGIPELNDPPRIPAAEASWMVDDEVVYGAVVDGRAVAYPFRIMGHHELANDTIGDTPVAVVLCTLCRTALAFDRRIDGQVLDFETSGLLLESNKVMVDHQTDTLWSHLGSVGLSGPLAGTELTRLPLETVTWAEWVARHPDTEVVDRPDPQFPDDPERPPIAYDYEPDAPYRTYYDEPDVWFPILDTPTGDLALKDEVIGVTVDGASLAVRLSDLRDQGPTVFAVGDGLVLLVPSDAGARVFDAEGAGLAEGPVRPSLVVGEDEVMLPDGLVLPRMEGEQGFWFAWYGRHTDTAWWPRPG